MHSTKNDLSPACRKKVTGLLGQLLADVSDLYSQCKQAHWNVRGGSFIALHELFDQVATEVLAAIDSIAERILQLGAPAAGTVRTAAKASRIKEYPYTMANGDQHADALSSAIASFNAYCRKAIDEADKAGDAVTADLLTQIASGLDKQMWFVEAHLPAGREQTKIKTVKG
jgi:starvation-inducible DNA-binding protein